MSLENTKLGGFISHADSKKECLKFKDATISAECESFQKEIAQEMAQLCNQYHEDL